MEAPIRVAQGEWRQKPPSTPRACAEPSSRGMLDELRARGILKRGEHGLRAVDDEDQSCTGVFFMGPCIMRMLCVDLNGSAFLKCL